jgi:acyl-homoserine-lactone acylase
VNVLWDARQAGHGLAEGEALVRVGRGPLVVLVVAALAAASCSGDDDDGAAPSPPATDDGSTTTVAGEDATTTTVPSRYEATIRRDGWGVPHILAADIGSAGFGQGWAMAEDRLCDMADQVVKVRGERSRWFGAGEDDANLVSDLAYRALDLTGRAEADLVEQPDDIVELLDGFVAGYNGYVAETDPADYPGWCADQPWVGPITTVDLMAYQRDIALLASSRNFIDAIGRAQPPGEPPVGTELEATGAVTTTAAADTTTTAGGTGADADETAAGLPSDALAGALHLDLPTASNGWAVGADRATSGGGLSLINPHFPWIGELRLWESQITVPGVVDVYGATLPGAPGVLIGFNRAVAWMHPTSPGNRFTAYSLDLVAGDPTSYLFGAEARAMEGREVAVEVLGDDGELTTVTRTMWSTHQGPVVTIPGVLDWTDTQAFALRDANIENDELISQFWAMDTATSLDEFIDAHEEWQGIPWVHTVAAGADGRVWYADTAATPDLSAEAIAAWQQALVDDPLTAAFWDEGVVLLDGGDPRFDWVEDDGARDPGVIPFSRMPQEERTDWVYNANDSHWMPHPDGLLTGFSPLQGAEGVQQTLRTRMNAIVLADPSAAGPSGDDGTFTLEELRDASVSNRGLAGELLRDQVVTRCRGAADLAAACDVLAAWDLRFDLDSAGAPLWRAFLGAYDEATDGSWWSVPFNASEPVLTPNTLTAVPFGGEDPVVVALRDAVGVLTTAGIPLDAPLGDWQYTLRTGERIPIPGGTNLEGATNIVDFPSERTTLEPLDPAFELPTIVDQRTTLAADGWPIDRGTSFLMAVEVTADGPRAYAVLTYSQSADPDSIHFGDQTALFSSGGWREVLFEDADIVADPDVVTTVVRGD